jgi:hypothetical protein
MSDSKRISDRAIQESLIRAMRDYESAAEHVRAMFQQDRCSPWWSAAVESAMRDEEKARNEYTRIMRVYNSEPSSDRPC